MAHFENSDMNQIREDQMEFSTPMLYPGGGPANQTQYNIHASFAIGMQPTDGSFDDGLSTTCPPWFGGHAPDRGTATVSNQFCQLGSQGLPPMPPHANCGQHENAAMLPSVWQVPLHARRELQVIQPSPYPACHASGVLDMAEQNHNDNASGLTGNGIVPADFQEFLQRRPPHDHRGSLPHTQDPRSPSDL